MFHRERRQVGVGRQVAGGTSSGDERLENPPMVWSRMRCDHGPAPYLRSANFPASSPASSRPPTTRALSRFMPSRQRPRRNDGIAYGRGRRVSGAASPFPNRRIEQLLEGRSTARRFHSKPLEQIGVEVDGGSHEMMLTHHTDDVTASGASHWKPVAPLCRQNNDGISVAAGKSLRLPRLDPVEARMKSHTRHLGLMVCSSAIAHIGMAQAVRPAAGF